MRVEEGKQIGDAASVRWAGDRDRLMAGERPESPFREDAIHWVRVYRDLLAFNSQVMEAISERLPSAASPNSPGQPDLELLQAHLDRLRWRLTFWEGRIAESA
jgi:hypothetical protein